MSRSTTLELDAVAHGDQALRDALDTCVALGLELDALVPAAVLEWYYRDDYFAAR